MANLRESIAQGRFEEFVQKFMLTMFPNKDYPKWTVDAFNAVNINLGWKLVDTVHSAKTWLMALKKARKSIIKIKKQPPEVLYKNGVLKNSTKFTGKRLCRSLFFNNLASVRSATLLRKRLRHKSFPVNFEKFLGTTFSHLWAIAFENAAQDFFN